MSTLRQTDDLDEEAADWLVRLADEDSSAEDGERHEAFLVWVKQSPRHVKAFLEASEAFSKLDGIDPLRRIDVARLLEERGADVIPLRDGASAVARSTSETRHYSPSSTRRTVSLAAAALAACGVALGWWLARPDVYETSVGEQRTYKLDDGSMLYLNTQSRAQTVFSSQRREVRLLEGEGLFNVERDPARPFIVSAPGATIRALGTRFNVYERHGVTRVSVVDGLVQVVAAENSVKLAAGEEASIAEGRASKAQLADVSDAVAWRERRLVFRDAPLSRVAAEFNRYNRTKIRLEGQVVRDIGITGVFSADHPLSVVLYLAKDETLAVDETDDAWVVRRRR